MRKSLKECTRAVTAEDYRTIAMQTPGLRIADAVAIPFFDPDMPEAPRERLANVITVVVLPYSSMDFPAPDKRFLEAVRGHIENYRLITTRIKISAPVYVKIDIFACVICDTSETKQAKKRLEASLRGMLSVYGEDGRTRFGETVSESEVTARLCAVDSILSVKQIRLSSDNANCRRDGRGGIVIPPNAIACCGAVTIETETPKG